MQYLLRNYNKFLVGSVENYRWEDFYFHRQSQDFKILLLFTSKDEAQQFIDNHPDIEDEFDAWIEDAIPENWSSSQLPWEVKTRC